MSYSGKQSNEVGRLILALYCRCEIMQLCSSAAVVLLYTPEMAGHRQGSEVPPEAAPPQHRGVPWLLPEGAHSMGECVFALRVRVAVALPGSGPWFWFGCSKDP